MMTGCTASAPDVVTFQVVVGEQVGTSTAFEIRVCERTTALKRNGSIYVAAVTIDCEGEALLVGTNPPLTCDAGYVTSGVGGNIYRIEVHGTQCSLSLIQPKK